MAKEKQQVRNPESTLFKKLTRVFSGPIVNRRQQTYKRLRTQHMDKFANKFKSVSGQSFKKSTYNPSTMLQSDRIANYNRAERYKEFNQMEYIAETHAALNIYADELCTSTSLDPVLRIDCANEEIKIVLESLYYNTLNVNENLYWWARQMVKYGDFFLYLDIEENEGIVDTLGLPPAEVELLEGEDETNLNYLQYQWNARGLTFENWQVAHFRNLGDDRYAPYGSSIFDPVRRHIRQLILLEDTMMSYRIVRAPERRVYYIDVGDINPMDVEQYMEKVITSMKRHILTDHAASGNNVGDGTIDLRYNPWSVEEDIYIPIRTGTQTKVESLPGGSYIGDIDDVKYIRDKVLTGLNIPFSYLAREETGESQETLTQKDVRFANTIQRLQIPVVRELEKMGQIHLISLGYESEDIVSFKLSLNNPSKIAELQNLEVFGTKLEKAIQAMEGPYSFRYVAQNILGLSEDEAIRIKREKYHDAKYEAILTGIREGALNGEMGLPSEEGDLLGLGDGEMDLDGDIPTGDDELDLKPELDSGGEGGAEGELLVTPPGELGSSPGKRDEYETAGSKGKKYRRVVSDKRKGSGPRKKNYAGKVSTEKGKNTRRNVIPYKQYKMPSLTKGIMESTMDDELEKTLEGMFDGEREEIKNFSQIESDFRKDTQNAKKVITELKEALGKKDYERVILKKEAKK
jgi:hypothetical protein